MIVNWLYSFHMPLFFFAAGWIYKEKSVVVDLKRRLQTIVVPYFSFGFPVLIYWQLIERSFRESDMSFLDSLFGLFSGEYGRLDFNVHLWFLPCFFVTVIMFNLLVNLGKKRLAYFVAVVMSVGFIFILLPELPWGVDRVFKYIAFYAGGVLLADKTEIEILKSRVVKIIVGLCLLGLNFGLAYLDLTTSLMWFVTGFIGVFACVLLSKAINKNRLLQYFGRISLIVLCLHGPIYRIVVKMLSMPLGISTDGVRENFILAMIVVAITMAICSVAYEIVVRLAPWMVGKSYIKNYK